MTDPESQSLHEWQACRRRARRSWLLSIAVAALGTLWFLRSYQRAEPTLFALLLLIPLLSLRAAWRHDRVIRACNARISELLQRRA